MLHWMLHNSQTPLYFSPYTFSPTTVSLQHLFFTAHFLADIQCSFLEHKILKQLRECLQSYQLTQPRQVPVLIHQQLQARCMWNQLLAYFLKIFWTLFILCFPGFFPFQFRPLFLSYIFSISYSLLFSFSLHSHGFLFCFVTTRLVATVSTL